MPNGYSGKMLRVDLNRRSVSVDEHDEAFYRRYLGGWNVVGHYLLNELQAGADPLGPENVLVFAPGVITGAPYSGSGRNSVGAKSPLTGGFGTAEAGGYWGPELKHAGWDGIVVTGRSETPVWISIYDDRVEFHDATPFMGQETKHTHEAIKEAMGGGPVRTCMIGVGGEKLVKFSAVANDVSHFAGRTGLGAVMGSKNLKAIGTRASGKMPVADPAKIKDLAKFMVANALDLAYNLRTYGTGATMTAHVQTGNLPTRNFRDGNFLTAEQISAQAVKATIRLKMESCFACAVRCKKVVADGAYDLDPAYGGPEYEGIAAFGSNTGCDHLHLVAKANELCQRYGLDVISAGCTIAFAFECFEAGLLSKADCDGMELTWGNAAVLPELTRKIAFREGIGDLLAEGSLGAARRIGRGAERFAIQVKGLEVPMHEPRFKHGLGLGYAVSATGADHNHNMQDPGYDQPGRKFDTVKVLGITEPVPVADLSQRKVELYRKVSDWEVTKNSMVLCNFIPWDYVQMTECVQAATGWDIDVEEMTQVGERGLALARAFNVREGFRPQDDDLPERFYQPATRGPLTQGLDRQKLAEARANYYRLMGWDEHSGAPLPERLAELQVPFAAVAAR